MGGELTLDVVWNYYTYIDGITSNIESIIDFPEYLDYVDNTIYSEEIPDNTDDNKEWTQIMTSSRFPFEAEENYLIKSIEFIIYISGKIALSDNKWYFRAKLDRFSFYRCDTWNTEEEDLFLRYPSFGELKFSIHDCCIEWSTERFLWVFHSFIPYSAIILLVTKSKDIIKRGRNKGVVNQTMMPPQTPPPEWND